MAQETTALADAAISVVLPTYNEKDNVVPVIQGIIQALGPALHEIIVVDDNSPDGTADLVRALKNPKVKVNQRIHERGLASALADGVNASQGKLVAWLDCDQGMPPETLLRFIPYLKDYDLVVGSRYVEGGKDTRHWFRSTCSVFICWYARIILGVTVKDMTSGFALVKRPVFNRIRFPREGFGEYFPKILYDAKRAGFKATEVGYVFSNRTAGESKVESNPWVFFRAGMLYLIRILLIRFRGE